MGEIGLNPGLKKPDSCYLISIYHWNLNILAAYNFEKVGLLDPNNTVNKIDIICVSESDSDSLFSSDNKNINIEGCKLVRAGYPNNIKTDDVCAYLFITSPDSF